VDNNIFATFPEIETERLLLREILPEDGPAIFRIFSDPEVTRYYDLYPYSDLEQAQELIEFFDESFELERAIRWGIVHKEDDELIGSCGYVWLRQYRGEIGYEMASPYWRQGYMSEALNAILEFGYEDLELNRIEALVMRDNVASAGLLRSLGFQEEGLLRQHDFFKGHFHDMRMFSLLREEFIEE
jgi:[ribosomal protein S5]-alanine N-acetyltransferase